MGRLWLLFVHSAKPPDNTGEAESKGKGKSKVQNIDEPNKPPDQNIVIDARVKVMLFAGTEGTSLENGENPYVLCEAIAHSSLGVFEPLNERRDLH